MLYEQPMRCATQPQWKNQSKTPMELFAQMAIAPKRKHFHTYGCPTYILDNKLQGSQAIDHAWASTWDHHPITHDP